MPWPCIECVRFLNLLRLLWESSLIDNLLNFAGTPKGLLLLQQTGKINECVAYMNERYIKKLQVQERFYFNNVPINLSWGQTS